VQYLKRVAQLLNRQIEVKMSQMSSSHRLRNVVFLYVALFSSFTSLTSAQITTNVNTSTCGITKSCWKQPDTCSTGTCTYLLTWKNNGNGQSVSFEMEGAVSSINSWVSFGLSYDQQMGTDSVVDCIYNSQTSTFSVQSSWNSGHDNQPLANPQLGLVSGSTSAGYVNGHIVCQFQRLISVSGSSSSNVFPLDSSTYYILMALGSASNGVKQMHSDRTKSSDQFNFTASVLNVSASTSDESLSMNLMKAHGILMVLAWMVFASFGMLLPRYFKPAWPNSTWFGKKIWFQIHQPCMILTLLLTSAGFIIIFIEADDYVSDLTSPTLAHPPLGIVVMALVLINPIMAIFRCEPNDKRRIIFNIFHFIVGLLAHLSAVVTIFLGLYMTQLNLPMWTKAVMAAYICFHALIEFVLAIHMHRDKFSRTQSVEFQENIAMEPVAVNDEKPIRKVDSGSKFKTVVLIIHLCGVLGFAIAISVQIGITSSSSDG
jgi:hypothetical protein